MVLHFKFSSINEESEDLIESFNEYCCDVIDKFLDNYKKHLSERIIKKVKEKKTAFDKLVLLSIEGNDVFTTKIFIMVDDYDIFSENSI